MKIHTVTKISITVAAIAVLASGARIVPGQSGSEIALAAGKAEPLVAVPLGLPAEDTAKAMLDRSIAYHHPQWIDVPMGATKIHTFVIYPTLAGTAPVVVITANGQGLSDWVRAVGTEVVSEGYIAVVPDLLSGSGPNGGGSFSFPNNDAIGAALGRLGPSEIQRRTQAVRDYFEKMPGSNHKGAILAF